MRKCNKPAMRNPLHGFIAVRRNRQEEIARMLGGLGVTNAARKTAAEMIGEAGG